MIKILNVQVFNFEGAFRGLRNPMNSWHLSDSIYETLHTTERQEVVKNSLAIASLFETSTQEERNELALFLYNQATSSPLEKRKGFYDAVFIGPKDKSLAQRMIMAGTDESKFMRQIQVTMDIEAPLAWWKEADTYKVGTTANSCSTMHKLCSSPISAENFSFGDGDYSLSELDTDDYLLIKSSFEEKIKECEELRLKYLGYIEKAKEAETPESSEVWRKRASIIWRTLVEILPCGWMQKRTITLNYQVLRSMYFARKHHKLKEWRDFCKYIEEELPYASWLICYTGDKK